MGLTKSGQDLKGISAIHWADFTCLSFTSRHIHRFVSWMIRWSVTLRCIACSDTCNPPQNILLGRLRSSQKHDNTSHGVDRSIICWSIPLVMMTTPLLSAICNWRMHIGFWHYCLKAHIVKCIYFLHRKVITCLFSISWSYINVYQSLMWMFESMLLWFDVYTGPKISVSRSKTHFSPLLMRVCGT